MRKLGWVALPVAVFVLSAGGGWTVAGQERSATPPLVITAFGGKPVTYKAPRTPWGDPDLQGVWSSDDADMSLAGRGGGGGRGGVEAACLAELRRRQGAPAQAAPAGPPPLYLDDAALKARQDQVAAAAKRSDTQVEGSFRFDYARRAFPQTRLLVDPADGRLPSVWPNVENRGMPRGTYGPGPLNSWTRLLALRALHHPRHRRLGPARHLRQRQPDRAVARRGGVLVRDAVRHAHLLHRRAPARQSADPQYLGDSRARWEGEELVVETTNLTTSPRSA